MVTRHQIFGEINDERNHQDAKWGGPDHDDDHSLNDFVAYITLHAGKAVDVEVHEQREQMIKVAALATAVVEKLDRATERPAPG